jgi:hypothetical protein
MLRFACLVAHLHRVALACWLVPPLLPVRPILSCESFFFSFLFFFLSIIKTLIFFRVHIKGGERETLEQVKSVFGISKSEERVC